MASPRLHAMVTNLPSLSLSLSIFMSLSLTLVYQAFHFLSRPRLSTFYGIKLCGSGVLLTPALLIDTVAIGRSGY